MFKTLKITAINFFLFLFDFIFPRGLFEEEIDTLTPEDVENKAIFAERLEEDHLRPVFSYKDPYIKNLIWFLKYHKNKRVSEIFAKILGGRIVEDLSEERLLSGFDNPLLIAVPMHPKKKRERGFNQAEMLCLDIKNLYPDVFDIKDEVVIKSKETKAQSHIKKRGERMVNLRGCFEIREERKREISGRNIIVIDDVITTGSTMKEIVKVLKKSGAKNILCYSIAH